MTPDCTLCGKPEPTEWCWEHRWECPVQPPRGVHRDLWIYLTELRQRIENLEADVENPGPANRYGRAIRSDPRHEPQ